MSRLKYVGKAPDSDASIVNKGYVDAQYAAVKVDTAYVAGQIAANTASMVNQTYVDGQDALRAKKTAVDAADTTYVPNSQRGVASGVASIGPDGFIPSGQLPSVITDRVPFFVPGTILISGNREIVSTTPKSFQAGTLTITDPGWPYLVLVHASIQGASNLAPEPASRYVGTGSYGRILALGPSDKVFAAGVTAGNFRTDTAVALPYAPTSEQPSTLTGNLTIDLWLSLWSGTTYTFSATNANYYAMVFPAI